MPPPADGSSTRGGSTSVRGRVRSPHISGGRPAAGSQRANSLGSYATGQTDGRIAVSLNALPPLASGGANKHAYEQSVAGVCPTFETACLADTAGTIAFSLRYSRRRTAACRYLRVILTAARDLDLEAAKDDDDGG